MEEFITAVSRTIVGSISVLTLVMACQQPSVRAEERDQNALITEAQTLADAATQAYTQGRYEEALEALKKAEALAVQVGDDSVAKIRFNIARCYEQLERWDEALLAYRAYNSTPDTSERRKERAWAAIQKLEKSLYARVSIVCSPAGVTLSSDTLFDGQVACPWQGGQVKPGTYEVTATYPGYLSAQRTVLVEAGASVAEEIVLEMDPESAEALFASAPPPGKTMSPWPFVIGGAGVATLGAGVLFHVLADDARGAAELLPPGAERDDKVSEFDTNRSVAYGLYAAGGVVVAGAIVYFVLDAMGGADDGAIEVEPAADGLLIRF